MQDDINRLHDKLDKLIDARNEAIVRYESRLTGVETQLEVYNDHLKEHMKRSDLIQEQVELYRKNFEKELFPIRAIKWIFGILVSLASLTGLFEFWKNFKG